MNIVYEETEKALPCGELHQLFVSAGWSDGSETPEMIQNYNIPFINSTLVVSAWEDGHLIGTVRVLSDAMFRSVIYDLVVRPEFQHKGIGKELVSRCFAHYPDSEWLVQTTNERASFYESLGFKINQDTFLSIPCKYFT